MKYTTTDGKEYFSPKPCNCGLTGGCEKCNDLLAKQALSQWKEKFNHDIGKRNFEMFGDERVKIPCNHQWEKCSDEVEHCPNCGEHRNLTTPQGNKI